jgi:2-keto-4-pentenoate hydratase/2-oxohepta-3-ene-1,7-dioic acid hydratase in catechol pathway
MGKSLDNYTIMGPVIVDRTELPMPLELDIKSYVNGELRQNSNTKYLIKKIPGLIAELSKGITLEAGDIIATGTPAGVGMGFTPPRFLKKGDKVTCEIDRIGQLTNYIV